MFDIKLMLKAELSFCDSFTNRTDTDYGKIYFNPLNPISYDSNHAHILRGIETPEAAIADITRFFRERGLTPRIYPSFLDNELEILRPHLENAGFKIQVYEARTFLSPPETSLPPDFNADIRRITDIGDDIISLVLSDNEGDWTIKVLNRHVNDERFNLLGLYSNGKCVSMASVKLLDGCSRVDDVLTHPDSRGQHFGTRLMEHLVNYHRSISDNYLYLWAENPIAIRMYRNVGFQEIDANIRHWSAWLPKNSD